MTGTNKLTGFSTVTPAYGRDYRSAKQAIFDFTEGKDFVLQRFDGSGYCNLSDFASGATVNIRYSQLRKVAVYKVR